ncbi:MAG: hypothetical protein ABI611_09725 [Solirubrobacteraceae bacterium]
MARDLIPPPSPAGRPSGDADAERERAREREESRQKQKSGLWHRSPEAEATTHPGAGALAATDAGTAPTAEVKRSRADTPFRSRFGLLLGALLGLGIAALAIGAAVYVGTSNGNGAPSGWSGWKPTADDGKKAAQQIATHVGRKYRLADGNQIVGVEGGPLQIDALGLNVPLEIAMKSAPQGGNIDFIKGNGLMYTLNGLGPKGSVRGGKPSESRHLLLRREALELALYSFRYIKNVDLVVALLPPAPPDKPKQGAAASTATTDKPTQALFFRPGDLEPQLQIPLGATIPAQTPRPETIAGPEAQRIDALTRGNLFLASFQQGQDQKAYLVLDRLPQ